MQVIKLDGRIMLTNKWIIKEGSTIKTIDIGSLQKGSYYLKAVSLEKEGKVVKFEKM